MSILDIDFGEKHKEVGELLVAWAAPASARPQHSGDLFDALAGLGIPIDAYSDAFFTPPVHPKSDVNFKRDIPVNYCEDTPDAIRVALPTPASDTLPLPADYGPPQFYKDLVYKVNPTLDEADERDFQLSRIADYSMRKCF